MSTIITDDILAHFGLEVSADLKHYGKKGMKWGVTRAVGANGKVTGKVVSGNKVSEDYASSRVLKGKRQAEMSNAELKKVNERLQLERSNKELQSRGPMQKVKVGTAIAASILAVGATANTAIQFAKSPAGQAVANAVRKSFSN